MVAPTYESEIERNNQGVATRIVLELIRRGTRVRRQTPERAMMEFRAVGSALTAGARRAVRSTPGWAGRRAGVIDTQVFGWIQATNLDNAASRFSSNRIAVGDIAGERIQAIMEDLVQSNEELTLYTSEWAFIFDLNTLRLGGAAPFTPPSWVGKESIVFWKRYEYNGHPLNCAAFSIAYKMTSQPSVYHHRVLKRAYDLMVEMNWSESVTPDQLSRFVEKYSTYRLTILFYHVKQNGGTTYDGTHFTTENKKKIIYLVLDLQKNHYALVWGPIAISNLYDKSLKYCVECNSYFKPKDGFFILFRMSLCQQ